MRKLIVILVVGGVLLGADVAAKSYAEGLVAQRIESNLRGQVTADADIDSFPFVGRLLVAGSAGDVHARVNGVSAGRLEFSVVKVSLLGVEVDRDLLLRREVSVTDIESGRAVLELGPSELSSALGVPVEINDNAVEVRVAGQTVEARPSADAETLRLTVDPLPALSVPMPEISVAPCAGDVDDVEVTGNRVRIVCTFEEVPRALVRAAGSRPSDGERTGR